MIRRAALAGVAGIIGSVVALAQSPLGGAAASVAPAPSIADERRLLAETRAQAFAASARAERLQADAAAAGNDADRAARAAAATASRIQAAEARIALTDARAAVIATLQREQRSRLATEQAPTVRLAAALEMLGRRPLVYALVAPGSFDDLVHTRALLASVAPAIDARTSALRADVARSRALADAARANRTALAAAQAALVADRDQLARQAVERRLAGDRLTGSALAEQDRVIALGEDARDIGELMARIDAAADTAARLATLPGPELRPGTPQAPRALPSDDSESTRDDAGRAPYRLPVIGRVVTGMGEVSATGVRARGLTIATLPGALVVAPTGGRVAFAGSYRGYGEIVIIDHGGGWTTAITGLAALDARVGDMLDQGAPVGRAGGRDARITVELRKGGAPVDIARIVA